MDKINKHLRLTLCFSCVNYVRIFQRRIPCFCFHYEYILCDLQTVLSVKPVLVCITFTTICITARKANITCEQPQALTTDAVQHSVGFLYSGSRTRLKLDYSKTLSAATHMCECCAPSPQTHHKLSGEMFAVVFYLFLAATFISVQKRRKNLQHKCCSETIFNILNKLSYLYLYNINILSDMFVNMGPNSGAKR